MSGYFVISEELRERMRQRYPSANWDKFYDGIAKMSEEDFVKLYDEIRNHGEPIRIDDPRIQSFDTLNKFIRLANITGLSFAELQTILIELGYLKIPE